MKQKKLMILGAGKNEVPAILKARERGVDTVVVDMNPHAPGLKWAHKAIVAKTRDVKEYLAIARSERIDGAMTVSCESLVRTIALITNALGLPGISVETALIATDKSLMRKVFHERGIPAPRFVAAGRLDEAEEKVKSLGWPLVIKPIDQAGSRGVVRLDDAGDLRAFFDITKNISRCGKVVIEEFVEGIESTIDAMTIDGKTHILGISDKVTMCTPNIITMDIAFPPVYSKEKVRQVENVVASMLEAVGLKRGASHTEVFVTEKGPVVIEFGARSGGALLPSDILPHLCGIDVIDALISMALGEYVRMENVELKNGADLRFFNAPTGRLKKIHGVNDAVKLAGVQRLEFIVNEGDMIKPPTQGTERIGFVITYGKSRGEAVVIADAVERLIRFEMYQ